MEYRIKNNGNCFDVEQLPDKIHKSCISLDDVNFFLDSEFDRIDGLIMSLQQRLVDVKAYKRRLKDNKEKIVG